MTKIAKARRAFPRQRLSAALGSAAGAGVADSGATLALRLRGAGGGGRGTSPGNESGKSPTRSCSKNLMPATESGLRDQ
jgi:hypothetical protein